MTHGGELQFTNKVLQRLGGMSVPPPKGPERGAARRMRNVLYSLCAKTRECTVTNVKGRWGREWKVQFKDGWFFKISWDPHVLEVITSSETLVDLLTHEERVDQYIYATTHEIGLEPENGSGHYNLGFNTAFKGSGDLFLRYFADYANRPELALGGLGKDIKNAPPLALLGKDQRNGLFDIINQHQKSNFNLASDVALAIQTKIYFATPFFDDPIHYQAVGLKSISGYPDPTAPNYDPPAPADLKHVELRPVFNQAEPRLFTLMAALQEARVKYLSTQKAPIIYVDKPVREYTESELYNRFFVYVTEMNLNFSVYKKLFTANHRWYVELDPFVASDELPRWRDPAYLAIVDNWAEDALISPFIRQKFIDAFAHSDEAQIQDISRIKTALNRVLKMTGRSDSINAQAAARELKGLENEIIKVCPRYATATFQDISRSPWKKAADFCKGLLNL